MQGTQFKQLAVLAEDIFPFIVKHRLKSMTEDDF